MIEKLFKFSLKVFLVSFLMYGVGFAITPRISVLTYGGSTSIWDMSEYWDAAEKFGVLFRAKVGFWLVTISQIPMFVSLASTCVLFFVALFDAKRQM